MKRTLNVGLARSWWARASAAAALPAFALAGATALAAPEPPARPPHRPELVAAPKIAPEMTPKLARQTRPKAAALQRVSTAPAEVCGGMELLPTRSGRPFDVGEELAYELSVASAQLGRFELKVGKPRTVQGKTVLPLFGRARTNAFLSTLKAFTGRYMAMVDPESLRPVGARVESSYGGDDRWEHIRFLEDQKKVAADFKLQGKEGSRSFTGEHALTDILSMLYAARSVALSPGMTACQDVFGSRRLWRMHAEVKELTKVKTPAGNKDAYLVRTVFTRLPHPDFPPTNPKLGRIEMDLFLSTDRSQTPLAFTADLQGVKTTGKLVRWSLKGTGSEDDWSL